MPQSFASLHLHIVFSTKHRRPSIRRDALPRLFQYMGGVMRNHESRLVAAGGMPDHVHLLASLERTLAVAELVRIVKSNTSKCVHDELGLAEFQWQHGYAAFAVSYSNLEDVKAYLANQVEHHRRMSFKEEFLALLRRHDLEWDDRFVWD